MFHFVAMHDHIIKEAKAIILLVKPVLLMHDFVLCMTMTEGNNFPKRIYLSLKMGSGSNTDNDTITYSGKLYKIRLATFVLKESDGQNRKVEIRKQIK